MDIKLIALSSKIIDVITESGVKDLKYIQYVLTSVLGYFQVDGASIDLDSK